MIGYHFVGDTLRDGRPVPADGVWLEHYGQLVMCESGLHGSLDPFDALQYAPGGTLCLVEFGGDIETGDDKLVAQRRRIIARVDAEAMLREFARWCALQATDLWDAPDVVRKYLETGDESLGDAAGDTAGDAAWDAARAASWAAAWAAAWDAQRKEFRRRVDELFGKGGAA